MQDRAMRLFPLLRSKWNLADCANIVSRGLAESGVRFAKDKSIHSRTDWACPHEEGLQYAAVDAFVTRRLYLSNFFIYLIR